jgi:hypothetical protein
MGKKMASTRCRARTALSIDFSCQASGGSYRRLEGSGVRQIILFSEVLPVASPQLPAQMAANISLVSGW